MQVRNDRRVLAEAAVVTTDLEVRMENVTGRELAEALFGFSASVQRRVAATDFPNGWEWHMHPGTWNRIKRDTEMARYITPSREEPFAKVDDLLGCAVAIDASMPLGAVELRFADQTMLPLAPMR